MPNIQPSEKIRWNHQFSMLSAWVKRVAENSTKISIPRELRGITQKGKAMTSSTEIGASTQTLDPQSSEAIYYERLEKAIRTTIAGLEGLRIADAIAVLNHAEATISKWTLVPDFSKTPFSLTLPPHP